MMYSYCPKCAASFRTGADGNPVCTVCGFVLYLNQAVTTAGIIVRQEQILFVRRALDPHKGMLDFPGGYVHPTEHPQAGMLREIREELQVEGTIIRLLGAFGPDPYPFQGIVGYNCALHYLVTITGEPHPADDAASIEWYPVSRLPDPALVAFPSQQEVVRQIVAGELDLA